MTTITNKYKYDHVLDAWQSANRKYLFLNNSWSIWNIYHNLSKFQ